MPLRFYRVVVLRHIEDRLIFNIKTDGSIPLSSLEKQAEKLASTFPQINQTDPLFTVGVSMRHLEEVSQIEDDDAQAAFDFIT